MLLECYVQVDGGCGGVAGFGRRGVAVCSSSLVCRVATGPETESYVP